jgi:ribonuclease VapC
VSASVLDASALLAYLNDEDGADVVADAVAESAAISAANLAETLAKAADAGRDPNEVAADLAEQGLLPGLIDVEPLTADDALMIGEVRARTGRRSNLSLAEQACLALTLRLGLPVLTADRKWAELDLDVDVRPIR